MNATIIAAEDDLLGVGCHGGNRVFEVEAIWEGFLGGDARCRD